MLNNRDDPILKEEEIETLSDLDELDELDNTQILDQFLSLLEVYENCLINISKLLEYVGKTSDSLSIRRDIKHEKDFALSLSKDLHELLYAHNSYIAEHHNLHVVRYKKKMQELNILFQRFKDLEKQYPASNLPETTVSSSSYYSLTPVYKKLSGYIFKQDETSHLEEELLKQHGIHENMEMSHDKLDELKNDLKELVSVFETLEESSTKKDKRKPSTTSHTSPHHDANALTQQDSTSTDASSVQPPTTQTQQTHSNGVYYGAAVVSLGLLAGTLIGGPLGMYVGGKIGTSIMTTASLGSGIGMIGSGLLLAGRGYFSRQEKQPPTETITSSVANPSSSIENTNIETSEHSENPKTETTDPKTPENEDDSTEESKKNK